MSAGQQAPPGNRPPDLPTPVPERGVEAPPAFGRFRLTRKLGAGNFGEVWRADDLFLGEPVAVKFLNKAFTGEVNSLDGLKREVRTLRRLSHPNIVRVHDLVYDSRHTAIVMEFIDGHTLAELLGASPNSCLQPEDIEIWLPQLASVFDYLHRSEGIIHSDLKPLNIMLSATGRLKVADFGLASTLTETTSHHTKIGPRPGTLAYMSPQQLRGARAAIADDIYALGATLFHLLTGTVPFRGNTAEMLSMEARAPTISMRRYETGKGSMTPVPDYWEAAIAACLSKGAHLRPASVRDVVRWLKAEPGGHSRTSDLGTSVILPSASSPVKAAKPAPPAAWQPLAPGHANPPPAPIPGPASPPPPAASPKPAISSTTKPSSAQLPRAARRNPNLVWFILLGVGVFVLIALLIFALRFL